MKSVRLLFLKSALLSFSILVIFSLNETNTKAMKPRQTSWWRNTNAKTDAEILWLAIRILFLLSLKWILLYTLVYLCPWRNGFILELCCMKARNEIPHLKTLCIWCGWRVALLQPNEIQTGTHQPLIVQIYRHTWWRLPVNRLLAGSLIFRTNRDISYLFNLRNNPAIRKPMLYGFSPGWSDSAMQRESKRKYILRFSGDLIPDNISLLKQILQTTRIHGNNKFLPPQNRHVITVSEYACYRIIQNSDAKICWRRTYFLPERKWSFSIFRQFIQRFWSPEHAYAKIFLTVWMHFASGRQAKNYLLNNGNLFQRIFQAPQENKRVQVRGSFEPVKLQYLMENNKQPEKNLSCQIFRWLQNRYAWQWKFSVHYSLMHFSSIKSLCHQKKPAKSKGWILMMWCEYVRIKYSGTSQRKSQVRCTPSDPFSTRTKMSLIIQFILCWKSWYSRAIVELIVLLPPAFALLQQTLYNPMRGWSPEMTDRSFRIGSDPSEMAMFS